jgi:hypothetical protein
MNTEIRVNFDNVKVNSLIEMKNHGLNDKIFILKVISIDEKIYNIGCNEYCKFIECELVTVPKGDINFYKENFLYKTNLDFYQYGNKFFTLEGYKLIN